MFFTTGLDLNFLRRPIEYESVHGPNLAHVDGCAGFQIVQYNLAMRIAVIDSSVRANLRAAAVRDLKAHAGQRFVCRSGDILVNPQGGQRGIVEGYRIAGYIRVTVGKRGICSNVTLLIHPRLYRTCHWKFIFGKYDIV